MFKNGAKIMWPQFAVKTMAECITKADRFLVCFGCPETTFMPTKFPPCVLEINILPILFISLLRDFNREMYVSNLVCTC